MIGTRKEQTAEKIEKKKADLALEIIQETNLRGYFEEELGLGLVVERGTKTLKECAGEAWGCLREGDRNREAGALVDSLYQVYHKIKLILPEIQVPSLEVVKKSLTCQDPLLIRQNFPRCNLLSILYCRIKMRRSYL